MIEGLEYVYNCHKKINSNNQTQKQIEILDKTNNAKTNFIQKNNDLIQIKNPPLKNERTIIYSNKGRNLSNPPPISQKPFSISENLTAKIEKNNNRSYSNQKSAHNSNNNYYLNVVSLIEEDEKHLDEPQPNPTIKKLEEKEICGKNNISNKEKVYCKTINSSILNENLLKREGFVTKTENGKTFKVYHMLESSLLKIGFFEKKKI